MKDIFVLGFDPVFLDIVVSPLDSHNNKLANFPPIGEHVTNTHVTMVPGGNALNVARILSLLTSHVFFFGAMDTSFLERINLNISKLTCFATSKREPNVTVALQFQTGEIQMNSVKSDFSINDITAHSLFYLSFSRIVPFSNIGLNTNGPALFDFIGSFFIELTNHFQDSSLIDNLINFRDFLSSYLNNNSILSKIAQNLSIPSDPLFNDFSLNLSQKIFYFDPSSLLTFGNWSWLQSFFVDKFPFLPGYKIISVNEHEFSLMSTNNIDFDFLLAQENVFVIIHESELVTILSKSINNKTILQVPHLAETDIVSSVGAGDAFNAGLLLEFSKSFDIVSACTNGITIAQKSLTNSF